MDKDHSDDSFAPFPYFTKSPSGKEDVGSYIVYSSATECKRVKARSAADAMKVSGIKKPVKIVRFNPLNQILLAHYNFE